MTAVLSLPKQLWALLMPILVCVYVFSTGIVNILQLLTLVIRPFNLQLYRKINYNLATSSFSLFVFVATRWAKCDVRVYMDPKDAELFKKEHKIILMNHSTEMDWMVPMILIQRFGVLGGMKAFIKQNLRFIPFLGWMLPFLDFLALKRDIATDEKRIRKGIATLGSYPQDYWITMFLLPEGTRFTKEKHETSMKIAVSKGFKELKYHLLPRTKGFVCTLDAAKKSSGVTAVYDLTMVVNSKSKLSLINILKGDRFDVRMRIRRYAVKDLPDSVDAQSQWLIELFKEKDECLDQFYTHQSFDLPEFTLPTSSVDLISVLWWSVVTLVPLFMLMYNIVLFGTFLQRSILLLIITLFVGFARWIVTLSDMKYSSKYGVKEQKQN